jgi:hypothetical protein
VIEKEKRVMMIVGGENVGMKNLLAILGLGGFLGAIDTRPAGCGLQVVSRAETNLEDEISKFGERAVQAANERRQRKNEKRKREFKNYKR